MTTFANIKWLPSNNPQTQALRQFVSELENKQWQHSEQHKQALHHALSSVLEHCKNHVAYYQAMLKDLDCKNIKFSDFEKLPILSKDLIREHGDALVASQFKQESMAAQMHAFHTSGSTGTPMKIYRGIRNILLTRALSLHYHLCHDRNFDLSNVNIVTSDVYNLSPGYWASAIETGAGYKIPISERSNIIFDHLLKLQPNYIQTHPSTLKRLIDISLERGQKLDTLKEVRTFGELLEPTIKAACKEHWDVALSDNYSSEEMATMAFSCPKHPEHYHVMTDSIYLEIVDEQGRPCAANQIGRILVTQLKNLAMPLIRYELGDMGVWGEPCDCGRAYPVLKRIEGRKRNLVVLPDGDTFHPVFDEKAILSVAPIKRYQIIQKDLHTIEINILGKSLSPEKENALKDIFNITFKNAFNFNFVYQNDIPFSKRNKFEIFKSEVNH